MLVRFHYKKQPLDVLWLDPDNVLTVESANTPGGCLVLAKQGLQYELLESPDDVANALNQARY